MSQPLSFRNLNLTGQDLSHRDLTGYCYDFANLTGANLTGATLDHTSFRYATLDGATLRGVDATAADFTGATLVDADLTSADLTDTLFRWADLTRTKLTDAVLDRMHLADTILTDTILPAGFMQRERPGPTDMPCPHCDGTGIYRPTDANAHRDRLDDHSTSSEAADRVTRREGASLAHVRIGTHRHFLLTAYNVSGDLTDREAAAAAGLDTETVCYWKRCGELRRAGYITWTGNTTVDEKSGTSRRKSRITEAGVAKLAELDGLLGQK